MEVQKRKDNEKKKIAEREAKKNREIILNKEKNFLERCKALNIAETKKKDSQFFSTRVY